MWSWMSLTRYLFQVPIDHVARAFKLDSDSVTLQVMPGITRSHLYPNGFEKMRVGLAFQLFGYKILRGLNFYKDELESVYGSIDATQSFFQ